MESAQFNPHPTLPWCVCVEDKKMRGSEGVRLKFCIVNRVDFIREMYARGVD